MADLQSAALATWLRSRINSESINHRSMSRYGRMGLLVKLFLSG